MVGVAAVFFARFTTHTHTPQNRTSVSVLEYVKSNDELEGQSVCRIKIKKKNLKHSTATRTAEKKSNDWRDNLFTNINFPNKLLLTLGSFFLLLSSQLTHSRASNETKWRKKNENIGSLCAWCLDWFKWFAFSLTLSAVFHLIFVENSLLRRLAKNNERKKWIFFPSVVSM